MKREHVEEKEIYFDVYLMDEVKTKTISYILCKTSQFKIVTTYSCIDG